MKIFAISSLKGGSTKTTSAVMLAACLPGKVLLIDMDHNNNATDITLRDTKPTEITDRNIYHVMTGKLPITKAIYRTEFGNGFDVIPASPGLSRLSVECAGNPGILLRFRSMLQKLDYDYVVIDTPPALVLELRAALYAADYVLCPVQMGRWTLQGFDLIAEEVVQVKEAIGRGPILKALPSMVTENEVATLRALPGEMPFTNSSIPRITSLKNTQNTAVAPKDGSAASEAYVHLVGEIKSWL
jgi:chromosome partitioning protein